MLWAKQSIASNPNRSLSGTPFRIAFGAVGMRGVLFVVMLIQQYSDQFAGSRLDIVFGSNNNPKLYSAINNKHNLNVIINDPI
jgi:hypothetical protein